MSTRTFTNLLPETTDNEIDLLGKLVTGVNGNFAVSHSPNSLTITVSAGTIIDEAGTPISVSAGTVKLKASATNVIVVDLFDRSLHAFDRAFHSAAVVVATVTTSASGVTNVTRVASPRLPANPLGNAAAKLRAGRSLNVLLYGDSITAGSGGSPAYYTLLFDSAQSAAGYNVPNVANVTLSRVSCPGATGIFGMAMIADLTNQATGGTGIGYDHVDQAATRLPNLNAERSTPVSYVGANRYTEATPDIVFIALGTNDNGRNLGYIEAQARFWRRRGVAVCLVTCNRRYDGYTSDTVASGLWRNIALANGCAIADTAAFMEEAYVNYLQSATATPYTDNVHPTAAGHALWARAINGLFANYAFPPGNTVLAEKVFSHASDNVLRVANHAALQLVHNNVSGTGTGTTPNPTYNLRCLMAGIAAASGYLTVTGAQYVCFGHPFVSGAIWAIVENQSGEDFSYTVTQQAGTTIASGSVTGYNLPFTIVQIVSAAVVQSFPAASSQYTSPRSRQMPSPIAARFNVTSGTAKLVGFLFETPIVREIPRTQWTTVGTWATEAGDYDGECRLTYTDTTNDRVSIIGRDCNAVAVVLRCGASSGQINFVADGVSALSSYETYKGVGSTSLLLPLIAAPGLWPNTQGSTVAAWPLANNRRDHCVQLKLTGVNGSASATSAGIRRLGIAFAAELVFD